MTEVLTMCGTKSSDKVRLVCKESHIVHRTRKNETPYQSLGIKRLEEVNLGKL